MSTSIVPTVGRIVLVKNRWNIDDVTAGLVVRVVNPKVVRVFVPEDSCVGPDCANRLVGPSDNDRRLFELECRVNSLAGEVSNKVRTLTIHDSGTGAESTGDNQWAEWMPYQHGQAAKTEEIAKKAGLIGTTTAQDCGQVK